MTTKVLCAVDGSAHAEVALTTAADLAAKYAAELSLCVVNVRYGDSPRGPQASIWTQAEVEKILADAEAMVAARGMKVANATIVSDREASSGIIHHAMSLGADHIVLGTGDKHGLERLVLGSVAKDVATRAPCTVTIAR
jgi:nucleotide-binding universal stress UspA family protein